MANNVFFENGQENIQNFIDAEFPNFSNKLTAQLINFCSNMIFYEEEGTRFRPTILFTNKIETLVKNIKNSAKQQMFQDENENMFRSRMKALIPFSKHNWNIYIQLNSNGSVEYGIYRSFNSIKEHSFETNLFLNEELKAKTNSVYAFLVQSISANNITFKSLKGDELNINFSLENKKLLNFNDEIKEFIDASFSKLKTTRKKLNELKTLYQNTFKNCFRQIHGCICVVIDKDYKDKGFFEDGVWLEQPIEFSKLFMQSNSFSESKLTSYSELFMDMLNYDGITIVDNKGRIRAYNVFVETSNSKENNILGGARKRAAFTVINSKVKKIVGVYFQSQEGEIFYMRNRNYHERKTKNLSTSLPTIKTNNFESIKQKSNIAKTIPLFADDVLSKFDSNKSFLDD